MSPKSATPTNSDGKNPEPKNEIVYALSRPARCYNCDRRLETDEIVKLKQKEDEREVLCQSCAGFGIYELLSSGNPKLTKLAGKYSSRQFTVMKWSDLWKCYERKGILVEPSAIDQAEKETGTRSSNRVTRESGKGRS